MADPSGHDELISEFVGLTGTSPEDARQILATNRWDLPNAVTEYFTAQDEGEELGGEESQEPESAEPYTGPRTLDGRPAPESASAIPVASSSAPPRRTGGIATLGSLASSSQGGHAGHGHAHDDGDNENDEDYEPGEQPRDLFAGGEKSGLAVQDPGNRNDPRKVVNDILKKARANAAKIGGESAAPPPTRFRGSGQTLGGDDTPSQTIPDPTPRAQEPTVTQTRILHLWHDGFSIEDGPLRAFSDPQNAADLNMIRQGRAPLHLMGVRNDQPVDVQLIKHEENYKPQPKIYKPFSGSGQRLGSPTPGPSGFVAPPPTPASVPTPATSATSSIPEVETDPALPTLSLRIQLATGARLPARFNTTQTVGDVYSFIERASPANVTGRPWVLATTFPNKDHVDKSLVLGEMAEFKRGGTAVQKWT